MDAISRLGFLSAEMDIEPAEDACCFKLNFRQQSAINIYPAVTPNGKRIKLLKTLLTSACERNCNYCPFRAGRDYRRATLSPDEMARLFVSMYRSSLVEGLFLSSGIAGGSLLTLDKIIATADLLRNRYQFKGYLHLKLMPGAEKAQVERVMQLADRVSLNLEAPNTERLGKIAPRKIFIDELIQPLRWVDEIRRRLPDHLNYRGLWPSMTTQFVVGAVGETDLELLKTTAFLQDRLHLSRAYFSAFRPVPDTPFEELPPESPRRQHRLYQAAFLLRDYGFKVDDLPFQQDGRLPLDTDPKVVWARDNLLYHPLEINRADRAELLKVPGIGPKGAAAILRSRRAGKLTTINDLRKLGIRPERALPYILLDGRQPVHQLAFELLT